MAEPIEDSDAAPPAPPRPRLRILRRIFGALLLLFVGLAIYGWIERDEIAADLITKQLDQLGLKASYGNSFGKSDRMRAKWTQGLPAKIKDARKEPVDCVWYLGDYASYDPRVPCAHP